MQRIDSSYIRTKREAERMVMEASGGGFTTIALCPGMVLGPRDPKPTSTQIVRALRQDHGGHRTWGRDSDRRFAPAGRGSSPRAGRGGWRSAVCGGRAVLELPASCAGLVASITGRPRWVVSLPDHLEPLIVTAAGWFGPLARWRWPDVSPQLATAGFLGLYLSGDRANSCLGLEHPSARHGRFLFFGSDRFTRRRSSTLSLRGQPMLGGLSNAILLQLTTDN